MARALKASIDIEALKANLLRVRKIASKQKILAMVKANGYGHGLVRVANALQEADAFGVACIEEAMELRRAGIQNRIVLMEGFFDAKEELPEIIRLNLEPVIHHEGHLDGLKQLSALKMDQKSPLKVWLKINTGMHRLGFPLGALKTVWQTLINMPEVTIEVLLSHFAKADEKNNPHTLLQMETFFEAVHDLRVPKSLANSAAILAWKTSLLDWVRPGLMLYGVSPFEGEQGVEQGLKPVMTLHSELIAIQSLKKNDTVGYGGEFVCPSDRRIGVVAIGYGDGYPQFAPEGTPVLLNGKPVPLIGRVSMDMLTVDLSTQPEAKVGDPIQLWGPNLPVETVAKAIGSSPYELLTGLSTRVPFKVL